MTARVEGPHLEPVEAARRLGGRPGRFLLDSASDADGAGRWCFVGAEPSAIVGGRVDELAAAGRDPFAEVAALAEAPAEPEEAGPVPLAVGWFGYDLGRLIERLPSRARAEGGAPDLWFGRYEAVWRFDRRRGQGLVLGRDAASARRLHELLCRPARETRAPTLGPLVSDEPAARHLEAIGRALDYIRAGDVYQVNLARRLSAPVVAPGDPLALYARVAGIAPAPFGALVEAEGATVLSDSPELFLRRAAGSPFVETRPIKGTRPRGRDAREDAELAAALAADEKERAEHLMIVDLERNDLGRVAEVGSVRVEGFARVVTLPTVHHLVSTVSCRLRAGVGVAEVLRATFPGGSITGAPKVRAMEIIDELEPVRRGVYTGAIGFLGAGGVLELAIVIRTAVVAGGRLSLHVGGGIVADSRPDRELAETEIKATAWQSALQGHP